MLSVLAAIALDNKSARTQAMMARRDRYKESVALRRDRSRAFDFDIHRQHTARRAQTIGSAPTAWLYD
jgi:hypothetical protein